MPVTTPRELLIAGAMLHALTFNVAAATTGPDLKEWEVIEVEMRGDGCFTGSIRTVADALQSQDSLCRSQAARILGLRGDRDARDQLIVALGDEVQFVRVAAALALARLGEPRFLHSVRELMEQSEDLHERASLAGLLADVGDASGYRYVEEECTAESAALREACVSSLRSFDDVAKADAALRNSAVQLFLHLVEDDAAEVRKSAALSFSLDWFVQRVPLSEEEVSRISEIQQRTTDAEVERILGQLLDSLRREREKARREAAKE